MNYYLVDYLLDVKRKVRYVHTIRHGRDDMNFLIEQVGGGQYVVIDRRTGQTRYRGSIDGARQAQAQLNAGAR